MANGKTKKAEISIRVYNAVFTVQEDRRRAFAQLDYTRTDTATGDNQDVQIKLAIHSIWVDPINNNAIKVYLAANRNYLDQRQFLRHSIKLGIIPCQGRNCIAGASNGVLRYGPEPGIIYNQWGLPNGESGNRTVHDSKSHAIKAILDRMSTRKTIAGLDLVTFRDIPDDILLGAGYHRVPDLMGRGVDMWMGSPDKVSDVGTEHISYREVTERQTKNVESFLKVLQEVIK